MLSLEARNTTAGKADFILHFILLTQEEAENVTRQMRGSEQHHQKETAPMKRLRAVNAPPKHSCSQGTPLFVHIWPPWLSREPGKQFSNYNKCREPVATQVGPFISDLSLFRWFSGRPESAKEKQRDQEKSFTTWKQKGNVLNRALHHSQRYLQNDLPTSPAETQKWRLCGHHHLQPTRSPTPNTVPT